MISYTLLYITSLIILYPDKEEIKNNLLYALIFCSFVFAQLTLGFISLLLIAVDKVEIPIFLISSFILLIVLKVSRKTIYKFKEIKKFFFNEIKKFYSNNSGSITQKRILYLSILMILLIFFSSSGPINHPDAADYHVGYPYQYFIRGGFFIDGSLHQGLLGIGDYANLSFIQEKQVWLIRTLQIINLPLLVLFLGNKINNKIFLLIFLSVPTFIQWSTIGKPLFLGESSLIVIYLIWRNIKSDYTLNLLTITSLSCLAFKISSIIIITPIFIEVFIVQSKNWSFKEKIHNTFKYIFTNKFVIFSGFVLMALLLSRYIITGNFAYPLLTNIFNKNEQLINEFSNNLMNYQKDRLFILKIFIPTKLTELSTSLGPAIGLTLSIISIKRFKNLFKKKDILINITLLQLIFLFLFGQARADYFVSPLILIIYQSDYLGNLYTKSFLKYILIFSTFFQISTLFIFLSFSIYLNFMSILNYEQFMSKNGFGFNLSRQIDNKIPGNIYISERNTRLYYPKNYIDVDKMRNCFQENSALGVSASKEFCIEKYNISQILSTEEFNSSLFNCKEIESYRASRNIFNKRRITFINCKKKTIKP